MSVITFDTVKVQERLKAEKVRFSTKADIARIERDLLVVKWTAKATFGGVSSLWEGGGENP